MMIAPQVADFDVYTFIKKSYSKPEKKEDQILSDANRLFAKIKSELTTKSNLESRFGLLEELYGLRVKVISWLLENKMFHELEEGIKEGIRLSDEIKADKRFFILAENVFYALKAKMNFMDALKQVDEDFLTKSLQQYQSQIPTNYNNFIVEIGQTSRTDNEAQSNFDFLNSSLDIEFVFIAFSMAHDGEVALSPSMLNELSQIVVDAAQTFSGIYFSMMKPNENFEFSSQVFSNDFINEQQLIADTGLEDLSDF